MIQRKSIQGGQKIDSSMLRSFYEISNLERERFISIITLPHQVGLLSYKNFDFDLKTIGSSLVLNSFAALLTSGHLALYKNGRDYGSSLKISLKNTLEGEYFVYFLYKRNYIPFVSEQAHGKTQQPDISVPAYELVLRDEILSCDDYPNALLLGKITIAENTDPVLDSQFCPPLAQAGGHTVGIRLLEKTQDALKELTEASECIYRQLRDTPSDSVFVDLKKLAYAQLTFLNTHTSTVRHWNNKTSLFECFRFWSDLANLFERWVLKDRLSKKQGDTLAKLYEKAEEAGQIKVEDKFLPALSSLSRATYDPDNVNEVVLLIEDMINYIVLSWKTLGNGSPITHQQNKTFRL